MTYKIHLKYILLCMLLWNGIASVSAQGWLSKDLTRVGDINVKELSESQKKRSDVGNTSARVKPI